MEAAGEMANSEQDAVSEESPTVPPYQAHGVVPLSLLSVSLC